MIDLTCTQSFLITILKQGHIPSHISFIMDGNRRHAISKNKESFKGHEQGKQSLKKYLLYCLQLGVQVASFFCFSIENFKRSQIQVNKLMELVLNTFDQVSEVSEFVMKKNVKVIIAGNVQMFRQDVKDSLKKVQEKTKNNTAMTVYLCFAYDSLDQINKAVDKIQGIQNENFKDLASETSYSKIFENLMIPHPIDILVRTSNQSRLSNFMLMQNAYSLIYILKQNWPQINLFSLAKILLHYNFHFKQIQKKKNLWKSKLQPQPNQKDSQFKEPQLINNQEKKLL